MLTSSFSPPQSVFPGSYITALSDGSVTLSYERIVNKCIQTARNLLVCVLWSQMILFLVAVQAEMGIAGDLNAKRSNGI